MSWDKEICPYGEKNVIERESYSNAASIWDREGRNGTDSLSLFTHYDLSIRSLPLHSSYNQFSIIRGILYFYYRNLLSNCFSHPFFLLVILLYGQNGLNGLLVDVEIHIGEDYCID